MADDESSDSVEIPVDQSKLTNGFSVPHTNVGLAIMGMSEDEGGPQPHIAIVEQPQARGFRFRYECEGPSHGGLQGDKSEKYRKTHPSIRIRNYNGPARVVVSLVTNEVIPRPHAHKLVGKYCNDGSCIMELKAGQNTASFSNLCIQHVTRRKAGDVIEQRIIESMKLDKLVKLGDLNAQAELTDDEKKQANEQAIQLAKDMKLNVVKLCFQAYLRDESGQFSRLLPSVLSTPIYDSKAPGANALKICRMDKYGGCCTGNEEVFLLCEKVQRDDISVRFVEQDDDGKVTWEAFGNFGPFDVHRQYAIVFKTPPYRDDQIDRPVHVTIMLQRNSDKETSDPKSFTYFPQTFDREEINKKRRKTLPSYPGSSGFGGGSGDSGRSDVGSNGFLNGTVSFHQPSEGNIPVMVNQDSDQPSTPHHHSINRSVIVPNRRQPRRIPRVTERSDIEVDGSQVPTTVPTVVNEVQQLPYTFSQQQQVFVSTIPQFTQQQVQHTNFQFANTFPQQFTAQAQGLTPRGGGGGKPSVKLLDKSAEKESDSQLDGAVAVCEEVICEPTLDEIDAGAFVGTLPEIGYNCVVKSTSFSHIDTRNIVEDFQEPLSQGTMELLPRSDNVARKCSVGCQTETDVTIVTEISDRKSVHTHDVCVQTEKDGVIRTAERTVSALQSYAVTGDIRQLLMVQRYLTSVCDDNGDLPLHTSIINSQLEVVHNLLDVMGTLPNSWLKINSYNNLLQTPLHLAVLTQQAGVVDRLLCSGANPTLPDRNGNTATHLAVQISANNCLEVLLKYQRPGSTFDKPFPELNMRNFCGFSPAHIAVQRSNQSALTCIVRGKGNINLPDGKTGRTPLHYAVETDNLAIAGYLILEADAFVNEACFNGNTALHIACGKQNVGMVALLMAAGADPNQENSENVLVDENDGQQFEPRGHKPQDYSMKNEKVLRVLRGEPYTVSGDLNVETSKRIFEQTTKNFSLLSLSESSYGLNGATVPGDIGDVDRIPYPVRVHLSKLLDTPSEGKDWLALADILGLRKVLEGQEGGFSPTRLLLTYYESCGGTIKQLLSALRSLGRMDAVCLISESLSLLQGDDCKTEVLKSTGQRNTDSSVDNGRSVIVRQMAAT